MDWEFLALVTTRNGVPHHSIWSIVVVGCAHNQNCWANRLVLRHNNLIAQSCENWSESVFSGNYNSHHDVVKLRWYSAINRSNAQGVNRAWSGLKCFADVNPTVIFVDAEFITSISTSYTVLNLCVYSEIKLILGENLNHFLSDKCVFRNGRQIFALFKFWWVVVCIHNIYVYQAFRIHWRFSVVSSQNGDCIHIFWWRFQFRMLVMDRSLAEYLTGGWIDGKKIVWLLQWVRDNRVWSLLVPVGCCYLSDECNCFLKLRKIETIITVLILGCVVI